MKRKNPIAVFGVLLGFGSAAVSPLQAQQAPATPANRPATPPAPVVELSPFEVSSARDEGFVAASAVAGGRLAIDLKDTPAAYSVLNKEFLDALQITGLEQAADWAPNTTRLPDHGHETTWGGTVLVQTRGVGSTFAQRDFFVTQMDFDSYNIDRVDFGRGPNAVLFGLASFGGVQTMMSKQARIDSTFGEARLSYGSWDKRRLTLDYNQRVTPDLAVRLNLMGQRNNGWRDGEYDDRYAAHLAVKYRLARHTEIRGELERGHTAFNTPYYTYNDQILGWNGTTVYNERAHNPAGFQANGVASLGNFSTGVNYFVFSPGHSGQSVLDFMGMGRTSAVTATSAIGGTPYRGNNTFIGPAATVIEQNNMPANRYDLAIANSKFRLPGTDDRFGLTQDPLTWRYYDIASVFVTHQFRNLYFELAGNYSINRRGAYHHVQNSLDVAIDINRSLPDGRPNPMFLEPYGDGRIQRRKDNWRNRNIRFSAAYVLDDTRLGSYTFQAMAGATRTTRVYTADSYQVLRSAEPADWAQGSEQIVMRRYLNHPAPNIIDNLPATVQYYDTTGALRTAPAGWILAHNLEERDIDFAQASIRGRWMKGRLVGIFSGRIDDMMMQAARLPNNRDLVGTNWDHTVPIFLPKLPTAELLSLTYVPKDANGNPTGPALPAINVPRDSQGFRLKQYANDRFQTDYAPPPLEGRPKTIFAGAVFHFTPKVSLAVNYSEGANFSGQGGLRYDGSPLPYRQSSGKDASLRFSLLDGRLNTTITYYTGVEKNEPINTANLNIARWGFNTILSSNKLGDLSPNGINARGVPLQISPNADVRRRENHGWEFETVANLTKAWRLTFNFGLPKAYQMDTAPDFRDYFDRNHPVLRQILADSGILIDANDFARPDLSVPNAQRVGNEHQDAATAWNNLVQDRRGIVTDAQPLARSMNFNANLYTDYTFPSGRLRGFKIGGGMNYRSRQVVGYRGADTIVNPANPATAIEDPDAGPLDVVKTDGYHNVVLNFGYNWRYSDRIRLSFDFKIDNLFNHQDPIYTTTTLKPPGGDLSNPSRIAVPGQTWWRQIPRNYTLAVTTRF